jgi:hypothetical protein
MQTPSNIQKAKVSIGLAISLIALLIWLGWGPLSSQAAPPPREPTPTPSTAHVPPHSDQDHQPATPLYAQLELEVQNASPGLWTVVQWQDEAGYWHDVEGWQGTLDEGYTKKWVVAAKDLGTGPFRWTVYQASGREAVSSEPFMLPSEPYTVLRIKVVLTP